MNFAEAVWIALSSLRANRLRSLLTLLGIVIGVMAVIAVVSIISGLNDYVASKIFNLGPDVLTVSRTSPVITSFDDWIENQKRKYLYIPDMDAIQTACANCKAIGAAVNANCVSWPVGTLLTIEVAVGPVLSTPWTHGPMLQMVRV